jgi:hypothetical protein
MSRGLGKIERAVIEVLTPDKDRGLKGVEDAMPVDAILTFIGEFLPGEVTDTRVVSIRRALRSLEDKGIARRVPWGGKSCWCLTATLARRAKRARERYRQEESQRANEEAARRLKDWLNSQPVQKTKYDRLAKLLGMLGSAHAGERDNAAQQIEAERKRLGLSWTEILRLDE